MLLPAAYLRQKYILQLCGDKKLVIMCRSLVVLSSDASKPPYSEVV